MADWVGSQRPERHNGNDKGLLYSLQQGVLYGAVKIESRIAYLKY